MVQNAPARLPRQGQADENSLLAALCLVLQLRPRYARMLVRLLTQDYASKEDLIIALSRDGRTATPGSMNVALSRLRRELARSDIHISTIPTLGHGLDKATRAKIHRMLAGHGRGIMPLAQSPGDAGCGEAKSMTA
jgi:hypothetical protein